MNKHPLKAAASSVTTPTSYINSAIPHLLNPSEEPSNFNYRSFKGDINSNIAMAKITSTMILCILFGALLVSSTKGEGTTASNLQSSLLVTTRNDPWWGQILPPQPRPGYYKFLGDCVDMLGGQCGVKVFTYIFENENIGAPCCRKVKKMGLLCSKALALTLGQIDRFKAFRSMIWTKSIIAFEKCSKF